jgi:hypothetical protein
VIKRDQLLTMKDESRLQQTKTTMKKTALFTIAAGKLFKTNYKLKREKRIMA